MNRRHSQTYTGMASVNVLVNEGMDETWIGKHKPILCELIWKQNYLLKSWNILCNTLNRQRRLALVCISNRCTELDFYKGLTSLVNKPSRRNGFSTSQELTALTSLIKLIPGFHDRLPEQVSPFGGRRSEVREVERIPMASRLRPSYMSAE